MDSIQSNAIARKLNVANEKVEIRREDLFFIMGHCFRSIRRLTCLYMILHSLFLLSIPSTLFSCLKDKPSNLRILQGLEIIRTTEHYSYFMSPFNRSKNYSEIKRILPLVIVEPGRVRVWRHFFSLFFSHHLACFLFLKHFWVIPFSLHSCSNQQTFKTYYVSEQEVNEFISQFLGTQSWARLLPPQKITMNNNPAHIPRLGLSIHTCSFMLRCMLYSSLGRFCCQHCFIISVLSSQGLCEHLFWLTCRCPLSYLINCLADLRSPFPCELRSWCQRKSTSVLLSTNGLW